MFFLAVLILLCSKWQQENSKDLDTMSNTNNIHYILIIWSLISSHLHLDFYLGNAAIVIICTWVAFVV